MGKVVEATIGISVNVVMRPRHLLLPGTELSEQRQPAFSPTPPPKTPKRKLCSYFAAFSDHAS